MCNVYLFDHLQFFFLADTVYTDFISFEWVGMWMDIMKVRGRHQMGQFGSLVRSAVNITITRLNHLGHDLAPVLYCTVLRCTVLHSPTTWRLPSLVMARAVLIWHMYWPSSLLSTSRMCRFHTLCPSCDTPIRGFLGIGGVNEISQ